MATPNNAKDYGYVQVANLCQPSVAFFFYYNLRLGHDSLTTVELVLFDFSRVSVSFGILART